MSNLPSINLACPNCYFNLDDFLSEVKRKRAIENAKRSRDIARANKTIMGRPKIRNDEQIRFLRGKGLSYSDIAVALGISKAAVQRGLK